MAGGLVAGIAGRGSKACGARRRRSGAAIHRTGGWQRTAFRTRSGSGPAGQDAAAVHATKPHSAARACPPVPTAPAPGSPPNRTQPGSGSGSSSRERAAFPAGTAFRPIATPAVGFRGPRFFRTARRPQGRGKIRTEGLGIRMARRLAGTSRADLRQPAAGSFSSRRAPCPTARPGNAEDCRWHKRPVGPPGCRRKNAPGHFTCRARPSRREASPPAGGKAH